jgi:hypothetical protein
VQKVNSILTEHRCVETCEAFTGRGVHKPSADIRDYLRYPTDRRSVQIKNRYRWIIGHPRRRSRKYRKTIPPGKIPPTEIISFIFKINILPD